jgi:hypothetical protein
MKTVLIFLLGAVVGLGGIYLYHKFGPQVSKTPYCLSLDITNGQRVPLKQGITVEAFENQLCKVDPNGVNGTDVNIKADQNNPDEVEGPAPSPVGTCTFTPTPKPIGPAGSMHSTQKVYTRSADDMTSVLQLLGSNSTATTRGSAGTAAGTEPTTPTPAPSP